MRECYMVLNTQKHDSVLGPFEKFHLLVVGYAMKNNISTFSTYSTSNHHDYCSILFGLSFFVIVFAYDPNSIVDGVAWWCCMSRWGRVAGSGVVCALANKLVVCRQRAAFSRKKTSQTS